MGHRRSIAYRRSDEVEQASMYTFGDACDPEIDEKILITCAKQKLEGGHIQNFIEIVPV